MAVSNQLVRVNSPAANRAANKVRVNRAKASKDRVNKGSSWDKCPADSRAKVKASPKVNNRVSPAKASLHPSPKANRGSRGNKVSLSSPNSPSSGSPVDNPDNPGLPPRANRPPLPRARPRLPAPVRVHHPRHPVPPRVPVNPANPASLPNRVAAPIWSTSYANSSASAASFERPCEGRFPPCSGTVLACRPTAIMRRTIRRNTFLDTGPNFDSPSLPKRHSC